LTLIGTTVFYGDMYLFGSAVMALYGLFTVFAVGVLAQLPATPRDRARVLFAVLPVTWLLVAAGTILAGDTLAAAAGMLVVGFGVAFVGVAGPRLTGVAAGLQLFYILACFGPYAPNTLGERLAGVTLSIVVLALAELLLWPDRVTLVSYPRRLADAAAATADYVEALADSLSGAQTSGPESARRQAVAGRAVDRLTFEQLPPTERPVSAGARDRALRDAAVALREMLDFADRLAVDTGLPGASAPTGSPPPPGAPGTPDSDLDWLLRRAAGLTRAAGRTLLGQGTPVGLPDPGALRQTIEEVRAQPRGESAEVPGLARLWLDAIVLRIVEQAPIVATAARIAARLPVAGEKQQPGQRHLPFWYAHRSFLVLYWQRLRVHLTPRSVLFQGAVRIALALAAARVIAGYLNLQHGFWVLLATLTLLRTSATDTRTTLRPALLGTVLGAAAGAGLLMTVDRPEVYRAVLPVAMVLAFAVGPLLGLAWGQGFVTLLLTVLFAQLGPANLQLLQARFLDVLTGAAIGVSAGLLLWPRGGGGELRRSLADYLDTSAAATEETVETLTGRAPAQGELTRAHRSMELAEASMMQYQSETPAQRNAGVNWSAVLVAGHVMVRGGQARRERRPPAYPLLEAEVIDPLDDFAHRVRCAYGEVAAQLRRGEVGRVVSPPPAPDDLPTRLRELLRAGGTRPAALDLVDLEVWLICLTMHLSRIEVRVEKPERALPLR
jgi:uncharacterized membrane protein YccC